jgi:hypothetical protein
MSLKLYIEPYNGNIWIKELVKYIPHTECSIEECDYIVSTKISYSNTDESFIQEQLLSYKNNPKRVIIFMLSDYNEPLDIPDNVIFFRSGMYKSKRKQNEHLIPYIWIEEELKGKYEFQLLQKKSINSLVGFCGTLSSHPSRFQHIAKLKMALDIKKKFIIRPEYWAGKPYDSQVVQEFINNIRQTYFTLCSRGAGNWSARFYQVLYLGRIPIVVNSDMILPFEDRINWRDILVYCDSEDDLNENIKHYWRIKDIEQAQIKCKEIYDTYLAPEKWFKIIADELLEKTKS